MDASRATKTVRLEIDATEPIGGWIAGAGRRRSRFDGWLQLISSLEHAAAEVGPKTPAPTETRPPDIARGP